MALSGSPYSFKPSLSKLQVISVLQSLLGTKHGYQQVSIQTGSLPDQSQAVPPVMLQHYQAGLSEPLPVPVQAVSAWFRMIDSYQSISYPVIISGSKLKVTMYSGKTIEIVNNANLSYIDFMRLN